MPKPSLRTSDIVKTKIIDGTEYGAIFDRTSRYRYRLWRTWDDTRDGVCFIMLNPSTADHTANDPTIARCVGFAERWGYGGVEVVNLFAYRVTEAARLAKVRDPIGPNNDLYLRDAIKRHEQAILAWGNHGILKDRFADVLPLLRRIEVRCFGITKLGQPKHPLYVAAAAPLLDYQS